MAIFDRFKSQKHNNEQDGLMRELKKIYQKEGLPFDEVAWCKRHSKIPNVQLYTCKNKCPVLLYVGESIPVECPYCGHSLRLLHSHREEALQEDSVRNEIAATGHLAYALASFRKGNLDVALSSLTRAIHLNPDFVDGYYNRSEVLIAKGDLEGAIDDCNQVIRLNPKDADAYLNRGSSKAQLGNYEGCIEDTTKALSLGFSGAIAYYNRGMSLVQLGRVQEAHHDLKKFLDLDPSDPRAESVKKMLNLISMD